MKVELLEIFGDDNMVVNVARVSYGKQANQYTEAQNAKLIKYLAEHGHSSPFRHPQLQFRIQCPIFIERQLFKHQIGVSVNSISGRYVDFSDSYYEMGEWRTQSRDSKQGSAEPLGEHDQKIAQYYYDHIIKMSSEAYQHLISMGVAKEQARVILPMSLNTEFIWTGSFQSFAHLCNLRLKPNAQQETRELVAEMLKQVKESGRFPVSVECLIHAEE